MSAGKNEAAGIVGRRCERSAAMLRRLAAIRRAGWTRVEIRIGIDGDFNRIGGPIEREGRCDGR